MTPPQAVLDEPAPAPTIEAHDDADAAAVVTGLLGQLLGLAAAKPNRAQRRAARVRPERAPAPRVELGPAPEPTEAERDAEARDDAVRDRLETACAATIAAGERWVFPADEQARRDRRVTGRRQRRARRITRAAR